MLTFLPLPMAVSVVWLVDCQTTGICLDRLLNRVLVFFEAFDFGEGIAALEVD